MERQNILNKTKVMEEVITRNFNFWAFQRDAKSENKKTVDHIIFYNHKFLANNDKYHST